MTNQFFESIDSSMLNRRLMLKTTVAFVTVAGLNGRLSAMAQTPATASGDIAIWTKFNLNTISSDEILTIPNAGDKMTREFAEYRPYVSIRQFRQEIGKYVDDATVASYERYLIVPVDPTQADAETIAQLQGVSSDMADELEQGVPYASDQAFLDTLSSQISGDQLAAASTMLISANTPIINWSLWNLNTVTPEQILTIPNTGDKMVDEFQEYRPYTSILQFRQEIGKYTDEETVAGYERYVFVPVDPANTDAETLAQLPGVSSEIGQDLAANVPYASQDDFIAAVSAAVSAQQAELLPAFLVQS